MSAAITRTPVRFYTVRKKKINKNIEGDKLRIQFMTLPSARKYSMDLYNRGNFKSLTNSNGVVLPI